MHLHTSMAFIAVFAIVCASIASASPDYPWAQPRHDFPGWNDVRQWYMQDIEQAKASGKGIQLLFYGDSITQCWRFGHPSMTTNRTPPADSICRGAPDVFAKHFGDRYNAKVFGIGGDQTTHLMYRLLHGEDPVGLQTKVAVLLIGTNDLGYALDGGPQHMQAIVPSVWQHIEAIVDFLTQPGRVEHVVLMGVLQRGNWHTPDVMFNQPSEFTDAINLINARVQAYAAASQHERVHFVDCSAGYLVDGGAHISKDLMPDALHPSGAGFEVMAQCLEGLVDKLMGEA